jgi:hypothetical protein
MSLKSRKRSRARSHAVPDPSHPIPIGTTVTVFGMPPGGAPFIEGRAVVKGRAHERHRYRVQFVGDPILRKRNVHTEYQRDSERMLEIVREIWRASSTTEIDEFFPEENN